MEYTLVVPTKQAVFDLWAANPTLAAVQVSYGLPRDYEEERLLILDAEIDQDWLANGRTREERFTVDCLLTTMTGGRTQREADDRAHELLKVVGDILRNDHTLGGLVLVAELKPKRLNTAPTEEGYAAEFEFGVAVRAVV